MFVNLYKIRFLCGALIFFSITFSSCGLIDDHENDDDKKTTTTPEPKALTEIIPAAWDGKNDWEDSLWLFKNITL